VLVVDFGAQYAQLIARRIRQARVYSEIVPYQRALAAMRERRPKGVVLSGGPSSVYADWAPRVEEQVYSLGVPILGICYGAQLIASQLGGRVERTGVREYGRTALSISEPSRLLAGLPGLVADRDTLDALGPGRRSSSPALEVWMSHSDSIAEAPPGFLVTASSEGAPVAAMEDEGRGIYAVQFHPEVVHSAHGQELIERFLFDVCGARPTWTHTSIIEAATEAVRDQVGDARVLCALSGGVDSAVAAALVHKAVGDQLTCVFVDTGLMREGEGEQVEETFRRQFNVDLVHVKAADRFFSVLEGVTDPEEKRKAIGNTFIRIFEEVASELAAADGAPRFLVQGTLYPDVIESGTGDAATIKSHHNVGGLPEDMDFELVEPLAWLFKDEAREIGEELGLPEEIVWRQPFPGPGLAVRIVGEVTEERVAIVRAADAIVLDEIRKAGLYRKLWQSFAVLPAVRSVGVMGDERTYAYPIVVRAVTSEDAMTADWARLDYDLLERISRRIIGEVDGVNRVVLDITSKPPGTIEWE
jgi:GMP synthase (glutamine-hydrolysing)